MELRQYQKECVSKMLWAKNAKLEGNSLCVLPTASGKSVIISSFVHQLNEPVLILQPSREILSQNLNKLLHYVDRSEIGVYSASMDEKTINYFTFATIGSVYKKPDYFKIFKTVILDEAHGHNSKHLNGMISQFLKGIGNPVVFGLTATPYRLDKSYKRENNELIAYITTKMINRMKGFFWKRILFNIGIKELAEQGYICPLEYIDKSIIKHEDIPVNKSMSEFDLEGYEKAISNKEKEILETINYAGSISKSILVFCSSVRQAERLCSLVKGAKVVSAKTDDIERNDIINGFRNRRYKIVFNMGVMTTGFDYPGLDCIILLRPCRSIGLYCQMLGRGVRIAEGKKSCKVIDLTSTVKNLGKFETIRVEKVDDKWNIVSETEDGLQYWHNRPLFSYIVPKKEEEKLVQQKLL